MDHTASHLDDDLSAENDEKAQKSFMDKSPLTDFLSIAFPDLTQQALQEVLASCDDPVQVVETLLEFQDQDQEIDSLNDQNDPDDKHPLDTLQDLFPDLDRSKIQRIWLDCNGDLERTAERLLDPEVITDESLTSDKPFYEQLLPPKGLRSKDENDGFFQVNKRKWDKELKLIQSVFPDLNQPKDEALFGSLLEKYKGNTDQVASLVSRWMLDNPRKQSREDVSDLDKDTLSLMPLFPNVSFGTIQGQLLRLKSIEAVVEYLTNLDADNERPVKECQGDCVESGYPCLLHSSAQAHIQAPKQPKVNVNTTWGNIWSDDVKDMRMGQESHRKQSQRQTISSSFGARATSSSQRSTSGLQSPSGQDAFFFRDKAQEIREQRNELYRKAALAFKRGSLTGTGSAAFYSEQARKMENRIEEVDRLAAEATLAKNHLKISSDESLFVIDVHGLTVKEALHYVDTHINKWYSMNGSNRKPSKRLKIITGVGNHSSGGVSKLYPVLTKYLKQKGWELTQGAQAGYFYIMP